MKLLKCHIDNFGKISDSTISFTDNLTVICRENGWGKSTLATFIKVMFFGFGGATKRDAYDNERKRFKPWQGGIYGGSLTFETEGKSYIIYRSFGVKDSEDSFELRNADTNLVTDRYTSDIGRELFQIDRESFERTMYIGQNDCETYTTAGIDAKIGNLEQHTNDLSNYERANDVITQLMNQLTPKRVTGRCKQLEARLDELKGILYQSEGDKCELKKLQGEKEKLFLEENEIKSSQLLARRQIKEISDKKDRKSVWDTYHLLVEDYENRANAMQELRRKLPEELPDTEQISQAMQELNRLQTIQKQEEQYLYTEEDRNRRRNLEDSSNSRVMEENESMIALWNHCLQQRDELFEKKQSLHAEMMERDRKRKQGNLYKLLGSAVICIVGILLLFLLNNPIAGAILATAGVAISIMIVLTGSRDIPQEESREITELENQIAGAEEAVSAHLYSAGYDSVKETYANDLYLIRHRLDQYQAEITALKEKEHRYREYVQQMEESGQHLKKLLSRLEIQDEENAMTCLQQMMSDLEKYQSAKKEYQTSKEKKQSYEQENHITAGQEPEPTDSNEPSLADMNQLMSTLEQRLEENHRRKEHYNRIIDDLQEKLEEYARAEEEMDEKREELTLCKEKFHLLEKTKDILREAKESFTSEYMEPMYRSFSRYLNILDQDSRVEYQLDANTKITVKECGLQREVKFLSCGNRDLIGMCTRMALIQAMYPEEKPFLILDDPFVNLDDIRLKGAREFLAEVSDEFQLIYLTCHGDMSASINN